MLLSMQVYLTLFFCKSTFYKFAIFFFLFIIDILVPIFSFSYCFMGMLLIIASVQISNIWSQAYHLTLSEMLFSYYDSSGFVGHFTYG